MKIEDAYKEMETIEREVIDCIKNTSYTEELPVPMAADVQREKDILEKNRQAIESLCKELGVPHQVFVGQPPPPRKMTEEITIHVDRCGLHLVVSVPPEMNHRVEWLRNFWANQLEVFISRISTVDEPIVKEMK